MFFLGSLERLHFIVFSSLGRLHFFFWLITPFPIFKAIKTGPRLTVLYAYGQHFHSLEIEYPGLLLHFKLIGNLNPNHKLDSPFLLVSHIDKLQRSGHLCRPINLPTSWIAYEYKNSITPYSRSVHYSIQYKNLGSMSPCHCYL